MPTSINPFVVFLGPSPGDSPKVGDQNYVLRAPYELPTAGTPHPGIYYPDGRGYWESIRELGTLIINSHAPNISKSNALSLIGQLNLGTGAFGQARNAPLKPVYCRWVPDVLMDYLRPRYVVLLGLHHYLPDVQRWNSRS